MEDHVGGRVPIVHMERGHYLVSGGFPGPKMSLGNSVAVATTFLVCGNLRSSNAEYQFRYDSERHKNMKLGAVLALARLTDGFGEIPRSVERRSGVKSQDLALSFTR